MNLADAKQGNLQFGSGSLQEYDGTSLAVTQDVVVVTINYRTNSKCPMVLQRNLADCDPPTPDRYRRISGSP